MANYNQPVYSEGGRRIYGTTTHQSYLANRIAGLLLFLLLVGIIYIYSFEGQISQTVKDTLKSLGTFSLTNQQTFSRTGQLLFSQLYIITSIFVVIGFSCVFIYYKKATATALLTVLFVVSLTTLLAPLLQKFWYNIFVTNQRISTLDELLTSTRFLETSLYGPKAYLDFYNMKISLANAISQLVVILYVYGKLSMIQVIFQTIVFNIAWNLNFFLCVHLQMNSSDPRIFDDYQISMVYLFGGFYGIMLMCFLKYDERNNYSLFNAAHHTSVMSLVGNFFLFLAFCGTTMVFASKNALLNVGPTEIPRSFIWQEAFISSFFALSASVIFFYAFSILFDDNSRFNLKGSIIGTISGGIMYGCVAGTCTNIGAAIACGLFAGFISALTSSRVAINSWTSLGGVSLVTSAGLASIFIAPIVIIAFYNNDVNISALWGTRVNNPNAIIYNRNVAGQVVVKYALLSAGIGLGCGLIFGLFLKCMSAVYQIFFYDGQNFTIDSSYGLKDGGQNLQESRGQSLTKSAAYL